MQDEEQLHRQLNAYLSGALPDGERQLLESRLAIEPWLRAEMEMLRLEREMAAQTLAEHINDQMDAWETASETQTQNKPKRRNIILWTLFVSIIVAIAAFFKILIDRPNTSATHDNPGLSNDSTTVFEQPVKEKDTIQAVKDTVMKISPSEPRFAAEIEPLAKKYKKAAGQKTYLAEAAHIHQGVLRTLSGNTDWQDAFLAGQYDTAWALLKPVVTDPDNTPQFKPLQYYFAALLQLYWDQSINEINASQILEHTDFSSLKGRLPNLDEKTFIEHRITALYAAGMTNEAEELIQNNLLLLSK